LQEDQAGSQEDPVPRALALALAHRDRLRAVHDVAFLNTPPQEALDRVTRLAGFILDAPVVLLTLIDDRRQYLLSQQGLPEPWAMRRETPLSYSLCQHVVVTRRPLVIEDAREMPLTASNLAVRDLGMVAYLGVPLENPAGDVLGALCLIDHGPRHWDVRNVELLQDLARIAMDASCGTACAPPTACRRRQGPWRGAFRRW
jgi:GAF domain-containing protein